MERILDVRGIEERRAVVTGCAGFIGSHLCERLVADGYEVVGIDSFSSYYYSGSKLGNLASLADEPDFELVEMNLASADLRPVMASAPLVRIVGVRFRSEFGTASPSSRLRTTSSPRSGCSQRCCRCGLRARSAPGCSLLLRVRRRSDVPVRRGHDTHPSPLTVRSDETGMRGPRVRLSPAGSDDRWPPVLHRLRSSATPRHGDPADLRGPRERSPVHAVRRWHPDVCITYALDVVEATVLAGRASEPSPIYNVGGGHQASLNEVIAVLEELAGRTLERTQHHAQAGDVRRTAADTTAARSSLGWRPRVTLRLGSATVCRAGSKPSMRRGSV